MSAGGLVAGVQVGDFLVERRLGAGGMGIVYQARQVSLNRPVALKVLGQSLSHDSDVARFQREAQAVARLKHPAIALVYYIGQDRHICYMAMELVDGISLRRVLDLLGSTTTSDTSFDTVVQADLNVEPEAAAVRFDRPTEALPKLGATRPVEPAPHAPADTNPYLSPKARDMRTSPAHVRRCAESACDAAEALVHAHENGVVHRDIKPGNLLRNIVTKPLPPVTWSNEAVPDELARIVHRATQKDPDQRYATARELVDDLNRFLSGESVTAPPYHYRIDEREITAARPGRIVLAAFVICLVSAVSSLGFASVGLMVLIMNVGATVASGVQELFAAVPLVGGVIVGRGLLAARPWARWLGVALFVLLGVRSVLGLTALALVASNQTAAAWDLSGASPAPSAKGDDDPATGATQLNTQRFLLAMLAMYALPLVVGALLGIAGVWWLIARKTSEWFALASQIRREHRTLREQLQ